MISITLPWPDSRLAPNARGHWYVKAQAVRKARDTAQILALGATVVGTEQLGRCRRVKLVFHPPDRRQRDIDNLIASCKAYLDGVCTALGIDDRQFRAVTGEWGEVAREGRVRLELHEEDTHGIDNQS